MTPGSAFHVVTFSLLQVLIYVHDSRQVPSGSGTGQPQDQWEDAPPTIGNSTAQGTLWNHHHTNVVNYGTADYPELASVSNNVHIRTICLPIDLLMMHQDLANRYTHPHVRPAYRQGIPEHMQTMFHVGANLSSLYMFLIEYIAAGESRK